MKVALFVPCYVDQLRPRVGMATLVLLERLGLSIAVPDTQSCCGQPLNNLGAAVATERLSHRFVKTFESYDAIVCPSGSCTAELRKSAAPHPVAARVFELSEFLVHELGWERATAALPASPFEHRVALHPSCHALRELGLGSPSELLGFDTDGGHDLERNQSVTRAPTAPRDTARALLERVPGVTLVETARRDECCGFGGSFCIGERGTSVRMGSDRIAEFAQAGAEVVTATDVSCLLHLEGVAHATAQNLRFLHLAELLAGDEQRLGSRSAS